MDSGYTVRGIHGPLAPVSWSKLIGHRQHNRVLLELVSAAFGQLTRLIEKHECLKSLLAGVDDSRAQI